MSGWEGDFLKNTFGINWSDDQRTRKVLFSRAKRLIKVGHNPIEDLKSEGRPHTPS
jgi:hypothetical protein